MRHKITGQALKWIPDMRSGRSITKQSPRLDTDPRRTIDPCGPLRPSVEIEADIKTMEEEIIDSLREVMA